MTVYNGENFLNRSISSILNQTFKDFEFIILDDASQDNSLAIIERYAKKDNRIRILKNKKNKKPPITRNILLKEANANIAAWMDADDISLPYRLQIQYQFLQENPQIDIVGSKTWNTPLNDHLIKSHLLLQGSALVNPSVMFRLAKIKRHKINYNKNCFTEDYQFWIDCASYCNFSNLDKLLLLYCKHNKQISVHYRQKQEASRLKILKKHLQKFQVEVSEDFLSKLLCIKKEKISRTFLKEIQEKYLTSLFNIENFYNYPYIHFYSISLVIHNFLYHSFSNKQIKLTYKELELVNSFLKEIFSRWHSLQQEKILKGFWAGVCRRLEIRGIYFFLQHYGLKRSFLFSLQNLKLFITKKIIKNASS